MPHICFELLRNALSDFNNFSQATSRINVTQTTAVLFPLSLILSLHYFVKCRSRSLAVYNNEFILGKACFSSENYRDHKIIENLLLLFSF